MSIKVLIVDDHSMIREGLKQLLEIDKDIDVIGEATNGEEAIEKTKELMPEVLLLDINIPKLNGIEVLKIIKKDNMNTKVVFLTIHNEIDYIIKAIDNKCDGYVLKDSNSSLLKRAIYTVWKGEVFIQPELIPSLNQALMNREEKEEKHKELTVRELEVLKLVAEGYFNKDIAVKLDISERTVKNHMSNIFKKIEVSDRTQAAVYAIKHSIVSIR